MLNQPKTSLTTLKYGNQKSAAVFIHCAAQLSLHLPFVIKPIQGDVSATTDTAKIVKLMCVCICMCVKQ